MSDEDLASMIADYMEKGFLENIIDMFSHDDGLCRLIGGLIQDERMRVRIGITALVEELARLQIDMIASVPGLISLLGHKEAVVRGDAVNLLGIIGDTSALPALRAALEDPDANVRLLAEEAVAGISQTETLPVSYLEGKDHRR